MNTITRWIIRGVVILATVFGVYFFIAKTDAGQRIATQLPFIAAQTEQPAASRQARTEGGELSAEQLANMTIAIQPAATVFGDIGAAGSIELADQRAVVAEIDGVVNGVEVDVGDIVAQGDLLVSIDTVDLERAVQQAELNVATIGNELAQLMEAADAADIAVAEANLIEAQATQADVLAGPSNEEIAAAQANVNAAWAKYNELLAGASDAELTQLSAEMRKTELAVAEAQSDYNQIAWQNDLGASSQASVLQSATIDYESALAAYAESTAPANTSDIQTAYSSAQEAQGQLDDLRNSPTQAQIATAEATTIDAQAQLDALLAGPTATELEAVQIELEQSLLDLEQAHSEVLKATITAPVDGVVVAVSTEIGQRIGQGSVAVQLTDPAALELTIEVAEIDIPAVQLGQPASVLIDAFPGKTFAGAVENISFTSDSTSGLVTYPVTIQLDDDEAGGESLAGVLPGMTAVATLQSVDASAVDGWLVPANAIRDQGDGPVVTVVADGQQAQVPVTTGGLQGEWTVIYSPELMQGDLVVGSVTSFISESEEGERPPGGGGRGVGGGLR